MDKFHLPLIYSFLIVNLFISVMFGGDADRLDHEFMADLVDQLIPALKR